MLAAAVLLLLTVTATVADQGSGGGLEHGVDWTGIAGVVRACGPAVVRVPTAALILGGQAGGTIDVSVLATPLPSGGPKHPIAVLTAIGGPGPAVEGIDLFVYALDAAGEVAAVDTHSLRLEAEQRAGKRGLKILSSLELPPGDYTLRVLASAGGRGTEYGLVVQPLAVPDLTGDATALLTPWWLEPLEPSRVALPAGDPGPALHPLAVEGDRSPDAGRELFLPAARPAIGAGATANVSLLARALGTLPVQLVARFESAGGAGIEAPFEVLERRPAPWPDLELLLTEIRLPELPGGEYSLRVVLRHPEAETVTSPSLPVTIEGAGTPQLKSEGTGRAAVDPPAALRQGRRKGRKYRLPEDETAGAYRHALRLLADGDTAPAGEALRQLETGAARHAAFDQLEKIERQVLLELEATSPDGLLPVALLHADLLPVYRRLALAPLAEHGLRMSRRLLTRVAEEGSPATRGVAGRALTELAGVLMRAGRLLECEELFELALDADKDNAVARLGLGVSHERRGRYELAAEVLEPLAEKVHVEARLRLALNLERLGKTERSRLLLQTLTGASPDWIGLLAAQETVRIAIHERRHGDASRALIAALERWPDHPGLRLQQAFLLDRRGKSRQARDQVASLIAGSGTGAQNPRDRYNRWPASDAAQRQLRASAGERLADLGRALEAIAP